MSSPKLHITALKSSFKIQYNGNTLKVPTKEIRRPLKLISGVDLGTNKLLHRFTVGSRKIIFYTRDDNLYATSWIDIYYRPHTRFVPIFTRHKIFFIGTFHHDGTMPYRELDSVTLSNYETDIKRPFAGIYGLRRIAFFVVDLQKAVFSNEQMHNPLWIQDTEGFAMPIRSFRFVKSQSLTPIILARKLVGDFVVAIRTMGQTNKLTISRIPYDELYKTRNILKNRLAYILSRVYEPKKNINLFFEKESMRAEESGFYVFTKVADLTDLRSKNYFILDKTNANFKQIKKQYRSKLIAKYSFRHFFYTYASSYLISSELSFHLFNPRIYLNTLRRVIAKKPLIFLQHGIMFAKPVENPAARGFYKANSEVNVYRSVISSELEATQFYKMGYKRKELIKCGLPKFDMQKETVRDKIVYMPTYRYWEEGLVNAGRIEETSYYQAIRELLYLFKKEKLLENFVVTSHPKFAEYIVSIFPEFSKNIEPNVTAAVESARIFITDFSSASYDAHLAGAYPIYFWKERKYLEENYRAKSALTQGNADGPAAYTDESLIDEVRKAIKRDYVMPPKYKKRYKRINEYNDGRNTNRLIAYLRRNKII